MDDNRSGAARAAPGAATPAPLMPDIINAHGFRVASSPAFRRRKRLAEAAARGGAPLKITE